jgi:tetratricopeptide (TPR) repeat protein
MRHRHRRRLLGAVRRRRAPYAVLFGLAIVLLLTGAVSTFRVIGASALRAMAADSAAAAITSWPGDSPGVTLPDAPVVPARAAYERFATEDSAWRNRNARALSVEELRARGDGKRTPREAMQDRVYRLQRAGRREPAIGELERWVRDHPRDEDALLSLARLLREAGRTDDALRRYRDALTLHSGR